MFCNFCGKEIAEGVAFCPECGANLEQPEVIAEVATEEVVAETVAEEVTEAAEEVLYEESVQEEVVAEESAETEAEETECEAGAESETAEAVFESVYGTDAVLEGEDTVCEEPVKKSNKLLVSIIACAVALAIVLAGIFVVPGLLAGDYEEVAVNYAVAYVQSDLAEASKYSVTDFKAVYESLVAYSCEEYDMTEKEFFEAVAGEYGATISNVDDLLAVAKEDTVSYFEEEYGNYVIDAKVLGTKQMTAEELAEIQTKIADEQADGYPSVYMNIDADKITAGYVVEVELAIKGDVSSESDSEEFSVVKYNGKWKAIS